MKITKANDFLGYLFIFALSAVAVSPLAAQSVDQAVQVLPQLTIPQSVIASGGGVISGGTINVTSTIGEPAAGIRSTGGQLTVIGGFFPTANNPTAAGVGISGRVTTSGGRGLRSAMVSLTDQRGGRKTVITSSLGYFRFEDVEVGQTYVIAVTSRRFTFAPRIISVTDDLTDIDFVAGP